MVAEIVPVVEIDVAVVPIPVIVVDIDKTGPQGDTGDQGDQGIQGDTGDTGDQGIQGVQGDPGEISQAVFDAHADDTTNPHGQTLTQQILFAGKATVSTVDISDSGSAKTLSFASVGAWALNVNADTTLTLTNIGWGQRGTVSLYCDSSVRTVAWVGIDKWLGDGAPELTANKLTLVTFFKDGVGVIAAASQEA